MLPELPLSKTADNTSSKIIALCQKIAPDQQAVYLDIEPIKEAVLNECYGNVAKVIQEFGGFVQYGWQIWETLPGVMAEAEFHAVWKDVNGNLHDVTPKETTYITNILFLPDQTRIYEGRQIDNIRIALIEDPLVYGFIKNRESLFETMNRGELANYHGMMVYTKEMENIERTGYELFREILKRFYQN